MVAKLGTKAGTLALLEGKLKGATLLPQFYFSSLEWAEKSDKILEQVKESNWADGNFIVRSSSTKEDSECTSNAGKYLSLKNISFSALRDSINAVFASYDSQCESDEVLIQPMLSDVRMSGVVFSRIPSSNAPYIVINYDKESGDTESVTSGTSNTIEAFYYFREAPHRPDDAKLASLIDLSFELESFFSNDCLDIEFALGENGILYLLQVRPLICAERSNTDVGEVHALIKQIHRRISDSDQPQPNLLGDRALYGVMPDWNPAEIIGVRPRQLALSLYKELITDSIWAYQRNNYGYRNMRSFPLLVNFSGMPYVDVRVDFNSFVPADIDEALAGKLVNYYLDKLSGSYGLHDKVEFEIVLSCYSFDMPERLAELKENGFSEVECSALSESLKNLTKNIIDTQKGLYVIDRDKINILKTKHNEIVSSDISKLAKVYWLIENCKRYGTLPFSGLARAAFVAVQMLKSLVFNNYLTEEDYAMFMADIYTVSSGINRSFQSMPKDEFLRTYGHLRPGTYDILSPRYDQEPDRYFDWNNKNSQSKVKDDKCFCLSGDKKGAIDNLLNESGMSCSVEELFTFFRESIEAREYAKFVFTDSLSCSLELIKEVGADAGFSIEDCSHVNYSVIHKAYSSSAELTSLMKHSIEEGVRMYAQSEQLHLPPLISHADEVWMFNLSAGEPNYITMDKVTALTSLECDQTDDLSGKVVMIQSADPGYDWIFSKNIAGIITMYGGANSHMAIRALELGIPSVIGVGELLFENLKSTKIIEIDCSSKTMRKIK